MLIVTFGCAAMYSSATSASSALPGSLIWMCHQSMVTGSAAAAADAATAAGARRRPPMRRPTAARRCGLAVPPPPHGREHHGRRRPGARTDADALTRLALLSYVTPPRDGSWRGPVKVGPPRGRTSPAAAASVPLRVVLLCSKVSSNRAIAFGPERYGTASRSASRPDRDGAARIRAVDAASETFGTLRRMTSPTVRPSRRGPSGRRSRTSPRRPACRCRRSRR